MSEKTIPVDRLLARYVAEYQEARARCRTAYDVLAKALDDDERRRQEGGDGEALAPSLLTACKRANEREQEAAIYLARYTVDLISRESGE